MRINTSWYINNRYKALIGTKSKWNGRKLELDGSIIEEAAPMEIQVIEWGKYGKGRDGTEREGGGDVYKAVSVGAVTV